MIRPLHESLGFALTDAQTRALQEIYADMQSNRRMSRLLQGDVGSGKTIVAIFAMLLAVEGGTQAALMAPTEILAEQHARGMKALLEPLGVHVTLLTGSLGAPERRAALAEIESGLAGVIVGTHALIQEGVTFAKLGLAVVDEQHRFGVRQRMAFSERADVRPDVLVMSATPIPRSLAMALYGDLDITVLDELPPGRTPVRTWVRPPRRRSEVYAFVEEQIAAGRQAYIVYPLVGESEKVDLRAATEEFERLRTEVFGDRRVGLIHGRLPAAEKDAVMRSFLAGEVDVLVATTVIEVGIDVANASVMVIEHAERFGLSQLHQLRGRVGRGAAESHCVLVSDPGDEAGERLKIFRDTSDGFELARADLRIRGQGDLFGSQQHGRDPVLRFADLMRDEALLAAAQRDARALIADDPELEREGSRRIRETLDERYRERLAMYGVG
jgi:ATP-dependent DNA helicase RecG